MSTKKDIRNVYHNKTKKVLKKKIEKVIVEKILSDEDIEKREGDFFSRKDFKRIFKKNCDVYYLQDGKEILLGKFRKKVLPEEEILLAIENLKDSSKREHDNRGAAAGKLDLKKLPIWIASASPETRGRRTGSAPSSSARRRDHRSSPLARRRVRRVPASRLPW